LRSRPTGIVRLPLTAAGESSRIEASRSFGTTRTQALPRATSASISASGRSCLSFTVSAWE